MICGIGDAELAAGATIYRIRIEGVIKGKQRPRATKFGRMYTPEQTVNAETWVRHCAIQQIGSPCLQGPIAITFDVQVEVPSSWSKKKQAAALSGQIRPTGKPDFDNSVKLACDALNGIVWKDDAQIVQATFSKRYAEKPGADLTVLPIAP